MKIKPKTGKLGSFSEGRVHSSDEGDIRFGVAADTAHGVVIINFSTPVAWLGLPPDTARQLAALLIAKADEIGQRPQ